MRKVDVEWEVEAEKRLKKAPFFVRKIARGKVEKAALEQGISLITVAFMERIKKKEMGR